MTGVEEIGALLASAFAAAAPEAGAAATAGAVGSTAAATTTAAGLGAAASTGLTVGTALEAGSALAGIGGTAAQLLQAKPKIPNIAAPQLDQARIEADQRNALLKRKGRSAALLTPGGAQGTAGASSPSLGAAALLGSG